MLKIKTNWGPWQDFWGVTKLPKGAKGIMTIEHVESFRVGALIQLHNGKYVLGCCGVIKQLNQEEAKALLAS